MTPDELQAIRDRYENATRGYLESSVIESHQDVPTLLDEVERLQPNVLLDQVNELLALGVEMRKEIAGLKKETERLRAERDDLAAFVAETAGADQTLTTVDEIARIARQTLAGGAE